MPPPRHSTKPLYLLFFFSGAAGLGYQIVWSKMFAGGLGHEMPALLAVTAAFMSGLAVGAWFLDKVVSQSPQPGLWYAGLEIVIGLWGAISAGLIPITNGTALTLIGLEPSAFHHWAVAFLSPFLVLLPATAAMGATLPAMERFLSPLAPDRRCVGGLYAANTLGAVSGTLLAIYTIVPALGFRGALLLLALTNILCGVVALWLTRAPAFQKPEAKQAGGSNGPSRGSEPPLESLTNQHPRLTLFFTGLLGIAFEVVGIRALAPVLENTIYTFASVLSVYLLGTAVGGAVYQRFERRARPERVLANALIGTSIACVVGIIAIARSKALYGSARAAFGDSPLGVFAAEMLVATAVFFVPTLFMGVTFSHLVQTSRRPEAGVGQAAAINSLGAALAPALFCIALLPWLGAKWTLVCIALGYLPLVPTLIGWQRGLAVLPLVLCLFLPSDLRIVDIPPGGSLVEYREGVMASVAVVKDPTGHRTLRVDNRFQMGGTAAANAEYRHAHVPLLLHPAPKQALFLGLGTGITFGAASLHPALTSDGVELVPEVVAAMSQFAPANFSPNQQLNLKLYVADARRFVRATTRTYDVVVADLFHPARDGAGSLYTLEHFQGIRDRLAAGGLFCQWLPLHQLDEPTLRSITRTFLEVFPDTAAYLLRFNVDVPVLGLIGYLERPAYDSAWVERRLNPPDLAPHLRSLALADSIRLFGGLLADTPWLQQFSSAAPLNTDNDPRVSFAAPHFSYQKHATAYGRLLSLLQHGSPSVASALRLETTGEARSFAQRLETYITARNTYIRGLVAEREGQQSQALEAFLESARLSADFTPGYAQCLTIASFLAKTKPQEAESLLQRLIDAQPARPVASEMLKKLREGSPP